MTGRFQLESMILGSFVPSDTEALAKVYRDAVRGIGPQAYSAEQVAAWASYPDNLAEFRDRMSHGLTLVTGGVARDRVRSTRAGRSSRVASRKRRRGSFWALDLLD